MADLTFNDQGNPNDLTLSDLQNIGINNPRYRILVVDTQTDQPRMLPISVLNQRFLYKNESDTFSGNLLTVSNTIDVRSTLRLSNSSNRVDLRCEAWTNIQYKNTQLGNSSYLRIIGGLQVDNTCLFKGVSVYSGVLANVNSPTHKVLLIGCGAYKNSDDPSRNQGDNPVINLDTKSDPIGDNHVLLSYKGFKYFESLNYSDPNYIAELGYFDDLDSSTSGVDVIPTNGLHILSKNGYGIGADSGGSYELVYPGFNKIDDIGSYTRNTILLNRSISGYQGLPWYVNSATYNGQLSDDRLKTRTSYPEYTLDQLVSIPVFEFYYNADETKKLHLGTSAQSLREVEPTLVHGEEAEDEYLSVEYDKLGLLALKGMQMLKKENDELRSEVEELKELVKQLINK